MDKQLLRRFYERQKKGIKLDAPLSDEDVKTFEKNNEFELPEDIKYYITTHSADLVYTGHLPKVQLVCPRDRYTKSSKIPLDSKEIHSGEGYIEGFGWVKDYDDRVEDPDERDCYDFEEELCMKTLHDYGCENSISRTPLMRIRRV